MCDALRPDDLGPWGPGAELGPPLAGGSRNHVHRARLGGRTVVVRRSTRPPAALDWELDLLESLARHGFDVPVAIPTRDGRRHVDGVVAARRIDGRPPSTDDDWRAIADELERLHALTTGWPQRPGFRSAGELLDAPAGGDVDLSAMPPPTVSRVRAAWAALPALPPCVVHGDPGPSNLLVTAEGRIALVDWDEARVDSPHFDLADLPVPRLCGRELATARAAAHAWEAANGWSREPAYARWRLALLDGYRLAR